MTKTNEPDLRREQNLSAALKLSEMGLPCFPCTPGKKPLIKSWQDEASKDAEVVRDWWRKHPSAIPAMPTGERSGLSVIDLDRKNGKDGVAEYERIGLSPNDAPASVRTATGGLHLYFEHVEGLRNSQGRIAPGIDVRGKGGYVIAPGAVLETGSYRLERGHIEAATWLNIGVPPEVLDALSDTKGLVSKHALVAPDLLREPLFAIPNDGSREEWVRIMMAAHSATGGSSEGLELVQEWSSGYPGYDPNEVEQQWRSFKTCREGGVTVRTLLREARKCGWEGDVGALADLFDEDREGSDCQAHGPIDELNRRHALVRLGASVAVADFRPNGDIDFISTKAFRELYSNRKYGYVSLGQAWMTHRNRRTYPGGVTFDPNGETPAGTLNLWRGLAIEPRKDAPFDLIHHHIVEVVARGNKEHADYVFSWLADIVQNPASKPGVALVLKGLKGVGKDTVAEVMKAIVGRRHTAHVTSPERLVGRFNAAFATALLIHVEEAIWGGQKDSKGVVQSLITCPSMPLERKHVDTVQVENYSRLLFTTNEKWAIPTTADERRYAVFEVSDHHKDDRAYFDALYHQIENGGLAGFLRFLLDWETPPGVDLRKPPKTRGLMEQKLSGLQNVEKWWYETLSEGDLSSCDLDEGFATRREEENWADGCVVLSRSRLRSLYEEWMKQRRYQGQIKGASEFGESLKSLCPGLEAYRPTSNGERPRCYRLPPLSQCREDFLTYMGGAGGEIEWPEDADASGVRSVSERRPVSKTGGSQ